MNCPKCNEPLRHEIYRENDYLICFYCNGAWLNRSSVNDAGIVASLHVTDNATGLECPECEGSQLLISHIENIELEHCPTCTGTFFDSGELEKAYPNYKDTDIDEIKSDVKKGVFALIIVGFAIYMIAKIAKRD